LDRVFSGNRRVLYVTVTGLRRKLAEYNWGIETCHMAGYRIVPWKTGVSERPGRPPNTK
jgi:DNA-binding response OmpR family regulator